MNFKLNALVAAALMAAAAPSYALMADATSGNGELLVNFRFYTGSNDSPGATGPDDISALFDLGVTMDSFLSNNGVAGYSKTWSLTTTNYGTAWTDLLAFAGASTAMIEFNVIALDNIVITSPGGSRYLTTADVATYPTLADTSLNNFQKMNSYVTSNNTRGTHGTQVDGASTATTADAQNTYFGKVDGGLVDGDQWANNSATDTTKTLATAQNFWFLQTSGTGFAVKTPFGVDLNGNGSIGTGEFGEWSVNLAAGTITYANPVPEASTYGMMLAGLGLVGFMARRHLHA